MLFLSGGFSQDGTCHKVGFCVNAADAALTGTRILERPHDLRDCTPVMLG
jgi:hypothetical protein